MSKEPRGIRNHNPGNIRISKDKWQGLADKQTDPAFFVFKSAPYGIRALARVLITYYDEHDRDTVRKVIARWAPPNENNTLAYVDAVARHIGVLPDEHIDLHDYTVIRPLVEAIIKHENGKQPYSRAVIDKALVLAGIEPPKAKVSRTNIGGGVSATAVIGGAALDTLQDTQGMLEPLVGYSETIKIVFLFVAVAGIGLTLYARYSDSKRGLR